MKIAQIAPLFESVPPQAYGGTERVVAYLTEALMAQGHEVTLFASGDSVTSAKLEAIVARGLRLDPRHPDWLIHHVVMIDRVFEQAGSFDVLHFHIDALHYPLARRSQTPCVTTMHGRLDCGDLRALHEQFASHPLVSISNEQRRPLSNANWCATIHHGLPQDLYRFCERPRGYFAFTGRISPEKRLDRAIDIAVACATPLRVAAKVDPVDRPYFEREIAHRLQDPLVEYLGEIGECDKNEFLGNARALLFPIDWPEPFGLAMIEALACGTPVIAYRCGSVPEVVQHEVTGYIVDDQAAAIEAARRIDAIDRRACREAFERRFTADRMAERYVDVYQALIDSRATPDGATEAAGMEYSPGRPEGACRAGDLA